MSDEYTHLGRYPSVKEFNMFGQAISEHC
ncbi:hypothetical protein [Francisella tularensis]